MFRMTDKTSPENDDISASTVTKAVVKADSVIVTIVAFIEDILFFTAAACVVAVFAFNANTGVSRGYLLVGAAAGFAAYLATVGRLTWLLGGRGRGRDKAARAAYYRAFPAHLEAADPSARAVYRRYREAFRTVHILWSPQNLHGADRAQN